MNNPSVPGSQPAPDLHYLALSRMADQREGWRAYPLPTSRRAGGKSPGAHNSRKKKKG